MLTSVEYWVLKKRERKMYRDEKKNYGEMGREREKGEKRVISRFQYITQIYDLIYLLLKMYY